jgi:hypothetical protein
MRDVSSIPPIEQIEPAVEPLRGRYLLVGIGLCKVLCCADEGGWSCRAESDDAYISLDRGEDGDDMIYNAWLMTRSLRGEIE